jgi:RNA polymerase sigma-70 factor (ECF subfamily)
VTPVQHQQTFQTWLDQHRALMFKVLRAYAFTPMDRDDLFQEIIIQVWRSAPAFQEKIRRHDVDLPHCAEHRHQVV